MHWMDISVIIYVVVLVPFSWGMIKHMLKDPDNDYLEVGGILFFTILWPIFLVALGPFALAGWTARRLDRLAGAKPQGAKRP